MIKFDVAQCFDTLSEYQKNQVVSLISQYMKLNTDLAETRPARCPCCGAEGHFIKKGFSAGKQRYACKECGKKFTYDSGSLTSWSHQSVDAWIVAIEDTLSCIPLDETRRKIGVCHTTMFYMRHKILCAIEMINADAPKLEGIIEADEAYVLESEKGSKNLVGRLPRRHGSKATKRGLSSEQLCVCTATDRKDGIVLRCVNRAKASSDDISKALKEHISEESVVLCDGADSYNQLIEETKCQKVELIGHESYSKVYHLNTVNGIHSDLSKMMNQFHGVATKYLNRYLALLSFLEAKTGTSISEKADNLRESVIHRRCFVSTSSIMTAGLLAV